jgi:hypothetical protein
VRACAQPRRERARRRCCAGSLVVRTGGAGEGDMAETSPAHEKRRVENGHGGASPVRGRWRGRAHGVDSGAWMAWLVGYPSGEGEGDDGKERVRWPVAQRRRRHNGLPGQRWRRRRRRSDRRRVAASDRSVGTMARRPRRRCGCQDGGAVGFGPALLGRR